jgi:hypothetical protein
VVPAGTGTDPSASLPPLQRLPLDKEHPLQSSFANRLAEDAESEKRNEHQQHDDNNCDRFLKPEANEFPERGSNRLTVELTVVLRPPIFIA